MTHIVKARVRFWNVPNTRAWELFWFLQVATLRLVTLSKVSAAGHRIRQTGSTGPGPMDTPLPTGPVPHVTTLGARPRATTCSSSHHPRAEEETKPASSVLSLKLFLWMETLVLYVIQLIKKFMVWNIVPPEILTYMYIVITASMNYTYFIC